MSNVFLQPRLKQDGQDYQDYQDERVFVAVNVRLAVARGFPLRGRVPRHATRNCSSGSSDPERVKIRRSCPTDLAAAMPLRKPFFPNDTSLGP